MKGFFQTILRTSVLYCRLTDFCSLKQKHVLQFRKSTLKVSFRLRHVTKWDVFLLRYDAYCFRAGQCCFRYTFTVLDQVCKLIKVSCSLDQNSSTSSYLDLVWSAWTPLQWYFLIVLKLSLYKCLWQVISKFSQNNILSKFTMKVKCRITSIILKDS